MSRGSLAGLLAALVLAGCGTATPPAASDDHLYPVPDFALTEPSGRTVRRDDLRGRVWIAGFIFTRCPGPCTRISGTMARLQHELAGQSNVRLVSFTVDPDYDTPAVLSAYAARYGADPQRWLFLTGAKDVVYPLIAKGFKLGVELTPGPGGQPGYGVEHSTKLAVVDRQGEIRGYFDGTDPEAVAPLVAKVEALIREKS